MSPTDDPPSGPTPSAVSAPPSAPASAAPPRAADAGQRAPWPLRLVRLPGATWSALARVLPTVALVRVLLAVLPYNRVREMFEPPADREPQPGADPRGTLRVAAWTGRTFLGDRPCLTQAIAARWLLGRAGYATELRMGATREEGEFKAHAWLEADGRIVLGGADSTEQYVTFRTLGEGRPASDDRDSVRR